MIQSPPIRRAASHCRSVEKPTSPVRVSLGEMCRTCRQERASPRTTRRFALELDAGGDTLDVAPGHADPPPAAEPTRKPADQPGALRPVARPDEDRDDLVALDREVVDVPAAPPVLVEQLTVEHLQPDV